MQPRDGNLVLVLVQAKDDRVGSGGGQVGYCVGVHFMVHLESYSLLCK